MDLPEIVMAGAVHAVSLKTSPSNFIDKTHKTCLKEKSSTLLQRDISAK